MHSLLLQQLMEFRRTFTAFTAWSTHCHTPDCGFEVMQTTGVELKLTVPIYASYINSLDQALASEYFAQNPLEEWVCKDRDDCQACQKGIKCWQHCWQKNGTNGCVLVDHGMRVVFQLQRFWVMPAISFCCSIWFHL